MAKRAFIIRDVGGVHYKGLQWVEGSRAVFLKRLVGVANSGPCGDWVDADLNAASPEQALRRCLRPEKQDKGTCA